MTGIKFRSDLVVELIDHNCSDESVLRSMLVSTDKDNLVEDMDEGAKRGRINYLVKNRHMSPLEHGSMTVRVEAPIKVVREWHRHRTQSYNEVSGRYVKLMPHFYIPGEGRPLIQVGKPGAYEFHEGTDGQKEVVNTEMRKVFSHAWTTYEYLLEQDVAKEVARGVLPVNTYTSWYATANPRNWLQFLSLRTKNLDSAFPSYPMWEIEQCAIKVESFLKELMPLTVEAWDASGRV